MFLTLSAPRDFERRRTYTWVGLPASRLPDAVLHFFRNSCTVDSHRVVCRTKPHSHCHAKLAKRGASTQQGPAGRPAGYCRRRQFGRGLSKNAIAVASRTLENAISVQGRQNMTRADKCLLIAHLSVLFDHHTNKYLANLIPNIFSWHDQIV